MIRFTIYTYLFKPINENGAQHNDHSKRLTINSDDADKGKLLE